MSTKAKKVYRVVDVKYHGKHQHYDIYVDNKRFLCGLWNKEAPLTRSHARKIVKALNA